MQILEIDTTVMQILEIDTIIIQIEIWHFCDAKLRFCNAQLTT